GWPPGVAFVSGQKAHHKVEPLRVSYRWMVSGCFRDRRIGPPSDESLQRVWADSWVAGQDTGELLGASAEGELEHLPGHCVVESLVVGNLTEKVVFDEGIPLRRRHERQQSFGWCPLASDHGSQHQRVSFAFGHADQHFVGGVLAG